MRFTVPPYDHEHENEITLFAETNFRNQRRKFGIKTDDRRRHMYIIGKTGMGKSTVLENMVVSDINAGHGLAYVDPHGDTAEKLLDFIPSNRINDVVYINPGDMDYPVGFNILETVDPAKKHLVAAGLMGVFKKIWPDVWSARMEYILLNTILALLDAPGSTLLGINRLLVDEDYRKKVVALVQDPVVKSFWVKEFAAFSEKYRTEAIAPVQNKVGQFLSASIIRNIVAQVKSTIDIREIMDTRKILILNLSKGLIGEENSRLLGGMIVTRLQLAAMERVDMPEKDRQDFYLYVDEFQNFATESFANILSEARKYRLSLIVAHQYIEQLAHNGDNTVRDAIFGNVGTIMTFRVGAADAEFMETEFMPRFEPEDLVNLGKYDIYLKLMINGAASEPFSASTLAPIDQRTGSTEKVIRVSRERNARPRQEIEEKVLRWSGMGTADEGAVLEVEEEQEQRELAATIKKLEENSPKVPEYVPPAGAGKKSNKPQFEIPCSVCGKIQSLSFEPDRSRPWFCKEDLEKRKLAAEARGQGAPAPHSTVDVSFTTRPSAAPTRVTSSTMPVSRPPTPPSLRPPPSPKPLTVEVNVTDSAHQAPSQSAFNPPASPAFAAPKIPAPSAPERATMPVKPKIEQSPKIEQTAAPSAPKTDKKPTASPKADMRSMAPPPRGRNEVMPPLRNAKSTVVQNDAAPISLQTFLGKKIRDENDMEVIIEVDDDEEDGAMNATDETPVAAKPEEKPPEAASPKTDDAPPAKPLKPGQVIKF